MKKDDETVWLKDVNSQSLQQSLKNLETAFNRFFKKQSQFPSFKKKSSGGSFKVPQSVRLDGNRLYIPKFKEGIRIKLHRKIKGKIRSATISKSPSGKYFASILVEEEMDQWERTNKGVGIDLGIKHLVITSDGDKYDNPKLIRKYKDKLRKAQKDLSRKVKGSNRYNRQKLKVAKIHEKITNSRMDNLHKISTELVSKYDLISIESLAVKNMVKNRRLSKSISDCGWSYFTNMLEYKCDWYGKKLVKIDRFFPSSKTCHECNYINQDLTLDVRSWECPSCNTTLDRDINASKNIYRQGLSITDMEGEALVIRDETTPCEVSKTRDQFDPEAHESLAHG